MDAKRALDIVASSAALVITLPLSAAVAAAVAADSPGGVLFRQERVGLDGRTFRIHKFRTMRVDHDGLGVSATGDARVTRVGRVLRATKLDELPQLADVLRGKMSIVGPRPELPQYVAMWPADQRATILSVRPGITDPVSIAFRDEGDLLALADDPEDCYVNEILPVKAAGYVDYVRSRTLVGDLAIVGRTLRAVLRAG